MLAGILAETILSGLIAPVMMIFQSSAVGEILFGRDAGWQVQRRDDGAVSHRDMVRHLFGADIGRDRHGRRRLCRLAAVAALDDAGDPRPAAFDSDRNIVVIVGPEPQVRIVPDPGTDRATTGTDQGQ